MTQFTRKSANILLEAAELQERKGQDYQNPLSRVRQSDHYPRGVYTILDTINGKMLRMYSVLETMESGGKVNFESVEDSAIDMINYASFLVAYMRGEIDGQEPGKDIFNRRTSKQTHPTTELYPTRFREVKVPVPETRNALGPFEGVVAQTFPFQQDERKMEGAFDGLKQWKEDPYTPTPNQYGKFAE